MQNAHKTSRFLLCLLFSVCALTPTHTRAITPTQAALTATSLFLAVSIWQHLKSLPVDRPNEYDTEEFNDAVKELKKGKNIKKNLAIVRKYSYKLWADGFCGHPSKVGSPRFNEKTKLHEIPAIDSRGIIGWCSDQIDPIKKTATFAAEGVVTVGTIAAGHQIWSKLINGTSLSDSITQLIDSAKVAVRKKDGLTV